jgi:hypothetical protein
MGACFSLGFGGAGRWDAGCTPKMVTQDLEKKLRVMRTILKSDR